MTFVPQGVQPAMPFPPQGLQPVDADFASMTGSASPVLRCIAQSDPNPAAAGDLLFDVAGQVDQHGAQIASAWTGHSLSSGPPLVLVQVPAGVMSAPSFASPTSTVPAVKARDYYVWVLEARRRVFELIGDAAVPSRPSEVQLTAAGNAPLPLYAQSVNDGTMFAELTYGQPVGGISGVAISGASFRTTRTPRNGRPLVSVVGFSTGGSEVLSAGNRYWVRVLEGAW